MSAYGAFPEFIPCKGTPRKLPGVGTNGVKYDITTGVSFTDGTTSSGLALGTVPYSDDAGLYMYDYIPVPDGDGCDSNVTSIKITTTGTFAFGGSPAPSFTCKYRVRIK